MGKCKSPFDLNRDLIAPGISILPRKNLIWTSAIWFDSKKFAIQFRGKDLRVKSRIRNDAPNIRTRYSRLSTQTVEWLPDIYTKRLEVLATDSLEIYAGCAMIWFLYTKRYLVLLIWNLVIILRELAAQPVDMSTNYFYRAPQLC